MLDALKGKPVEIPLLCLRLIGVARPFMEAASLKTAQLVDLRNLGAGAVLHWRCRHIKPQQLD